MFPNNKQEINNDAHVQQTKILNVKVTGIVKKAEGIEQWNTNQILSLSLKHDCTLTILLRYFFQWIILLYKKKGMAEDRGS